MHACCSNLVTNLIERISYIIPSHLTYEGRVYTKKCCWSKSVRMVLAQKCETTGSKIPLARKSLDVGNTDLESLAWHYCRSSNVPGVAAGTLANTRRGCKRSLCINLDVITRSRCQKWRPDNACTTVVIMFL